MCLIPDLNRDLVVKWVNRFYNEAAFCALEGWGQTEVTRKKLAQFIGADTEEISFIPTTASSISQAAFGIPLKSGDEILTWDQEYPSNFYPWRMAAERSGAKLIQVESDNLQTPAQKILDRVTAKTKVIAISWVQYQAGSVTDLKTISSALKGKNIWLVADVIQGVGVRPFHFHETGFDIICCGSHKFMCSSFGAGFMATKKSRMPEMDPIEVGAMTFGNPDTVKSFSIKPKTDGSRYEPGSKSMVEVIAMGGTLDLFLQTGIESIFKEATRLAKKLADGLTSKGYVVMAPEGPIINVAPKDPQMLDQVAQKLMQANVSFAKRGPGIRLSTHAYIKDEEIDRVLNIL